jgi:hypothetical protein
VAGAVVEVVEVEVVEVVAEGEGGGCSASGVARGRGAGARPFSVRSALTATRASDVFEPLEVTTNEVPSTDTPFG